MGPKLLFIFGIVLAHGALAAGWVAQDAPRHRAAVVTSCAPPASAPLHFSPRRELLAFPVIPAGDDPGILYQ